jgi:electron transport complex protein RnfA
MTVNVLLFFLAAFAVNLTIHLGLGLREMFFERDCGMGSYVFHAVNMMISSLILWHLFVYILFPLTFGLISEFLLYPLCFLLHYAFSGAADILSGRGVEREGNGEQYKKSVYGAVFILAAVIFTLKFAANSIEAILLSCGFAFGLILSALSLKAIRLRIAKEKAPPTLRGLPLMLVSRGLLSLVFCALAGIMLAE